MKEVEVKFKVADVEAVEAALEAAGATLSEPVEQRDTSYAPEGWKRGEGAMQVPFMRVRVQGEKTILTMKKPVANHLDRIERETEVSDAEETKKMIEEIGFRYDTQVNKVRRKTKLGEYEVCVDRVEKLGDFIEIEKLIGDDDDGVAAQEEIRAALIDLLGSDEGLEETHLGYDMLMYELEKETT